MSAPLTAFLLTSLALLGPALPSPAPSQPTLQLHLEGPISGPLIAVAANLTRRFYEDYPKLLQHFDQTAQPAPRSIRLVFDPSLDIPAHCAANTVTVSAKWLLAHPEDTALLTHELTHAVQQYPQPNPGWLTEGIADYARYLCGPPHQENWELPSRFLPGQHYREGYRTTARFLLWLEDHHPGTVKLLHRHLQAGSYQESLFHHATGKNPDELWKTCLTELGPR